MTHLLVREPSVPALSSMGRLVPVGAGMVQVETEDWGARRGTSGGMERVQLAEEADEEIVRIRKPKLNLKDKVWE